MGKVKWGGQELADNIETAEEGYDDYAGPLPEKGLYRFRITKLYKGESKNGFPQMELYLEMAPTRPEHKKYTGFFMRDWIIVKEDGSTGFRVKPFLLAAGITPKQFAGLTVIDEEAREETENGERFPITKIGPVKFPGAYVWAFIWPDPQREPYFKIKYKMAPEDADGLTDDNDADDNGEAPF